MTVRGGSSPRVWGTVVDFVLNRQPIRFIPTRVGNRTHGGPGETSAPVHPHACGEQDCCAADCHPVSGSSPRVWGTAVMSQRRSACGRFIPTRVGNRPCAQPPARRAAVHPHACGEQSMASRSASIGLGSSPRVWGTGHHVRGHGRRSRFIPTRVGNRYHSAKRPSHSPVHPHACGEQRIVVGPVACHFGSSPRVWGTGPDHARGAAVVRFIPTRVGNRPVSAQLRAAKAVHPHACGEQKAAGVHHTPYVGSSPRVWGTAVRVRSPNGDRRFIPTRVGNSRTRTRPARAPPVHPHACGEQAARLESVRDIIGSSPRVWGTVEWKKPRSPKFRFIPTRVGNRTRPDAPRWRRSVHPHACGEQPSGRHGRRRPTGSSPRVWGTAE